MGASDGWQDLKHNFKMDWEFGSALDGNIAIMGEIAIAHLREFTVAIGFGEGHHAALAATMGSLAVPFERHLSRFIEQWHRAATPRHMARHSGDDGRLLQISHNVVLSHEDKTFAGAFIASASIPWGYAKGDDDLGGYHLVWTRDMVQTATALMACGRTETALRALVYLACTQKPDGGFSQNFWVNGEPYWTGIQLDEVAFPIILAWRLWKLDGLGNFDVFPFVERAAGFLVRYAPVTQQERWEETAGYSPSTLAAVISALICAADMARAHDSPELAHFLEEHADWIESHLEDWTVTNNGVLHPDIKRHYMRIRPPECGDPYAHEECGQEIVHINNIPPGEKAEFEAREIIDAGFLELVRYGVRARNDPLIVDSLKVVDHVLKVDTPQGPCWRRYNHDGYGQRHDGGPFLGWGRGRAWPLLTGERAHYELAAGRDVGDLHPAPSSDSLPAAACCPSRSGTSRIRDGLVLRRPGRLGDAAGLGPRGVSQAAASAHDGQVFDRIPVVEERYAQGNHPPSHIEVFKVLRRQIRQIPAGKCLRITSASRFQVTWTRRQLEDHARARQHAAGLCRAHIADLPTNAGQSGALSFTLFWPDENRWEGRNFEVADRGVRLATRVCVISITERENQN